ncbi:histidinol-phosphate transaminase [Actinomycetota bacterium]
MSLKIKKWISGLPEYTPGRSIEEIKNKYGLKNVYKLASNENLYGLPEGLIEKICEEVRNIYYYPDADCSQIREKLGEKYGIPVEKIIIGSGSDQVIEMICDSFIGTGDNVVIADPTFPIYEKAALKCGGTAIKVPMVDFRHDIKGLLAAVNAHTKIMFLTNPHNPAGTNVTEEEFKYVLDKLPKDILLVMDEAYYEYAMPDERIDTTEYIAGRDNLMILRTFSKIFCLAGLRIGYGIGSAEAIGAMNKVRLPFNVSSIAQKAALYSLQHQDFTADIRESVHKQKQIYYNELEKNGIGFIRSYANFILIRVGNDSSQITGELLKEGFIVRPGENLGFPGYIRVTISTDEVSAKFLETFIKIYKNCNK